MNLVILNGNLGADPELRHTQGGEAVLNMRLATTETYLDKNKEQQKITDWHNLVMWGKRAEALSKHLAKGSSIIVRGKLKTSSYEDREGNKRYKTEVKVDELEFAGRKSDNAGAPAQAPAAAHARSNAAPPPDDFGGDFGQSNSNDDIPF
jgi:single-strand DNA-binding protein